MARFAAVLFLLASIGIAGSTALAGAPQYDLVIVGGRVIDPESGLDAVRSIGIRQGRIVKISKALLSGRDEIDASGLVVAPGFIDLHNHSPTPLGFAYQARDGVTTSLELEVGSTSTTSFGQLIGGKSPINYGASAGHFLARIQVLTDFEQSDVVAAPARTASGGRDFDQFTTAVPNSAEVTRLRALLVKMLDQGAIGIGLPLDYFSEGASQQELRMLFELAARRRAPLFIHVRRGFAGDSAGLDEVIGLAEKTGAAIHICHLSHSAMQNTADHLERIRKARARGVAITAELLPYTAGSTRIGAAVFGRDWRRVFLIGTGEIQRAATGEWFTDQSFEDLRKSDPRAVIIHHYVKEEWNRILVRAPEVMVASDGTPALSTDQKIPPQGVGTFAKLMGLYVREQKLLSLNEAIAKVTLRPARLLERAAPVFKRKGRLKVGADADITIFDAATIKDNATYLDPHQPSSGVRFLVVNGQPVIRDGKLIEGSYPGRMLLATDQ